MKARPRPRWVVLCGLGLVLAAGLWLAGGMFAIGGLSQDRSADYWFQFAVLSVVLATPWMAAVALLWRARAGATADPTDFPARLLAAAAATLPESRRDWGAAMTAELARLPDRSDRWRFALGCARVAVLPPRGNPGPVVATALVAAGVVGLTGLAVGHAFPPLRVLAVALSVLVGAAVIAARARSRRLRPTSSGVVAVAGTAGVGACLLATWHLIDQLPAAAPHLHAGIAVVLAAGLAVALGIVLVPPRFLSGEPWAQPVAVAVAAGLALGLLQTSRSELRGGGEGVFEYVLYLPILTIFLAALAVAAGRRSLRAGVQAGAWTAVLAAIAFFAVAVVEAPRWYRLRSSLILAGDAVPLAAVGETIRNFALLLVLLPVFWIPFGVFGAALGRAGRDRLSRARQAGRLGEAFAGDGR